MTITFHSEGKKEGGPDPFAFIKQKLRGNGFEADVTDQGRSIQVDDFYAVASSSKTSTTSCVAVESGSQDMSGILYSQQEGQNIPESKESRKDCFSNKKLNLSQV